MRIATQYSPILLDLIVLSFAAT